MRIVASMAGPWSPNREGAVTCCTFPAPLGRSLREEGDCLSSLKVGGASLQPREIGGGRPFRSCSLVMGEG